MTSKIVLDKKFEIEGESVVIIENVKTVIDKQQLESNLRDIQIRKNRLQEQNTRIVNEYKLLEEEEKKLKELISRLNDSSNSTLEEIGENV